MTISEKGVSDHYTTRDLGNRILGALRAEGKDLDALTVDDLAPVDEFHIRGRIATEELAEWAGIHAGDLLLDVGCGLGGTCRYLAKTVGCDVVGLDLTEEYCQVAEMLSARVGLAGRTSFRQGSALALPFAEGHFDLVWTEHVQMNISDKAGFYKEISRVLKSGGKLVFHDIFAGADKGILLPVPWASDISCNHLIVVEKLREVLSALGFDELRWEDKTGESVTFFRSVLERVRNRGWAPVGLHLLMGDNTETRFENLLKNLEEDRVRVVQAVMTRSN